VIEVSGEISHGDRYGEISDVQRGKISNGKTDGQRDVYKLDDDDRENGREIDGESNREIDGNFDAEIDGESDRNKWTIQ
jgi:hypothetical protein